MLSFMGDPMKRQNNIGFTLTELMAVVIIVAILAAVSVGYYGKAQEQSYFAEGLSTVSAIAEAVNRSYLDDQLEGKTPTKQPKISSLDVGISGNNRSCRTSSDYCVRTRYFEINIGDDGVTTATRTSEKSVAQYQIQIQPHFAATNRDQIACIGASADSDSLKFCQAMGYTQCVDTVCTKD